MEVKLYVGNLPYSVTEDDVRQLFAQAGSVTLVHLVNDQRLNRSKGFAFVSMASPAEAQKAIDLFNSYKLGGRTLNVKQSQADAAQPVQGRRATAAPNRKPGPRKPPAAPAAYQSRLSAFGPGDQRNSSQEPGQPRGGYQSRLSAFGNGTSLNGPRRRGGGKRRD